jgi:hypothetical protein
LLSLLPVASDQFSHIRSATQWPCQISWLQTHRNLSASSSWHWGFSTPLSHKFWPLSAQHESLASTRLCAGHSVSLELMFVIHLWVSDHSVSRPERMSFPCISTTKVNQSLTQAAISPSSWCFFSQLKPLLASSTTSIDCHFIICHFVLWHLSKTIMSTRAAHSSLYSMFK